MIMITIVILMLPVLKDHCDHDYHCVHNDHCDYDVQCNHDDNCDLDDHCEQLVQIIKMFFKVLQHNDHLVSMAIDHFNNCDLHDLPHINIKGYGTNFMTRICL